MNTNASKKTLWDFSSLGINEADFNADIALKEVKDLNHAFVQKWFSNNSYLTDPKVLGEALDDVEGIEARFGSGGNAEYYFGLRSTQEQDSAVIKGHLNKIHEIAVQIENDRQFFLLNVAKIPFEKQPEFLNSPYLEKYKHFIEILFSEAKYLLSDKEEKVLNLTGRSSYGNWVQMTSDLISREERLIPDAKGKVEKQNIATIIKLTTNSNKAVRDEAADAYNDILGKYVDIAEAEVNSIVQHKKTIDELRGYSRPDEGRIIGDDMEIEVVDSLLTAVSSRYDISRDFYAFKAKLFGLDKLDYHERNLDYGSINDAKYDYDSSINIVSEVFSSLDSEFAEIFRNYLDSGRFDVFPRKGKVYGAFCAGGHLQQPGYILLNHSDLLTDVTTIAHEMGHAINNELIRKKHHAFYFDTPLATAEVASTFMEDFVLDYIEKSADDELKLAILVKKLDDDVSAIMRQVACYKFEQDLHANCKLQGYLAKDAIGELFLKNMGDYMGPAVNHNSGSENWWVYWGHIRSFFYVYSYASGLLISKSLQKSYKEDSAFMFKIKEFLSSGTSKSPVNIFLDLGIDIKDPGFWLKGLNLVETNLQEAKSLAKKLGKI